MKRLWITALIVLASCSPAPEPETTPPVPPDIMAGWQSLADLRYETLLVSTANLQGRVGEFLETTDSEHLESARDAWVDAHHEFLAARVFFAGTTNDLLFRLDGWPLLEGFLDSLPAWPDSGIVNDFAIDITPATLIAQHGITSDREISLGFHALEYFLFARSLDDFVTSDDDEAIVRRRDAVRIITQLLVLDSRQFTELGRQRLRAPEEDASALTTVIGSIHQATERLLQEANALVEEGDGHSRFSETSWDNLQSQLIPLQRIVMEPVGLIEILSDLDEHEANNLEITIAQLSDTIESTGLQDDPDKTLLLLSALNHQFDRFVTVAR